MRYDIRLAGLSAESERRVRLAAKTLAVQGIDAAISGWEGAGCNLAIVGADDAYGRHVLDVAIRRKVPAITIGSPSDATGNANLPADVTISALAQALLAALSVNARPANRGADSATQVGAAQASSMPGEAGLLQSLYLRPTAGGSATRAVLGRRTIHVLPGRGRVVAQSMSDLVELRNHLAAGDWSITPLASESDVPGNAEVGISLDAYLVTGALHGADVLPPFPDGHYQLEHWPDLASARGTTGAMKIAGLIVHRSLGVNALVAATGLERREVSACLWAFGAAGLLRAAEGSKPVEPSPAENRRGIWTRIARHFGLG